MHRPTRPLALVSAALVALAGVVATPATASSSPTVEKPAVPTLLEAAAGTTNARGAAVTAHQSVLVAGRTNRVGIDLAPGRRVVADLAQHDSIGAFEHWSGPLEGQPDSTMTLVRSGATLQAVVYAPTGTYRYSSDGRILRVRAVPFRADHDTVRVPPKQLATAVRQAAAQADTPAYPGYAVIDVVIGWSSQAASAAAGFGGIQSIAALAVGVTNDAYAASSMPVRLRLVGTRLSSGTEVFDYGTMLNDLTYTGTAYAGWNDLTTLRAQKGADLATLLVTSTQACGMAWYPGGGRAYGTSVVGWDCAVDNLSLAHELGHNLGAAHDRYAMAGSAPYYSYGFGATHLGSSLSTSWRTIMAYNNQCADVFGGFCARIARFSSPVVRYNGSVTGGTTTDNRRAIINTLATVSGYYASNGPRVIASSPTHGAHGVPVTATPTVTFALPVSGVSTSTMTLSTAGGTAVAGTTSFDLTTRVARFTPSAPLTSDTAYVVNLTSGIMGWGVPLLPTTFRFTTGPAPRLLARVPANDARKVSAATNVGLAFSEPMSNVTTATFYLTDPKGVRVPATVTRSGTTNTWILNPSSNLKADTRYSVYLTASVTDAGGNPVGATRSSFVTGPPPAVTGGSPASGATNVGRTSNIMVAFSETGMAGVSTSTFALFSPSGARVSATLTRSTSSPRVWVLNPSVTLLPRTVYTVRVLGSTVWIRDLAGNPLTSRTWRFTTGS